MIGDENKISGPVCERESEYVGEIEQVRSRLKRGKTVRVQKGDCVIATTHDTQIGWDYWKGNVEKQKQVMRKGKIRVGITERENTRTGMRWLRAEHNREHKNTWLFLKLWEVLCQRREEREEKPVPLIQGRERASLELDMLRENTWLALREIVFLYWYPCFCSRLLAFWMLPVVYDVNIFI